jgi:hypothetical protein
MKSIFLLSILSLSLTFTTSAGFFDFFEFGEDDPWSGILRKNKGRSSAQDDNLQEFIDLRDQASDNSPQAIVHRLDFTQDFNESAKDVLESLGFEVPSFFVSDIDARFSEKGLVVGSKNRGYYGLRSSAIRNFPVALGKNPKRITRLKLEWGIEQYPRKENWNKKKKRRNSIAVVISFGPKTSEGSPYFIGFVLAKTGTVGQYYIPSRFKRVGRYTIVAKPVEGKVWTSYLELKKHFTRAFGANIAYPGVSGVGIEVDTRGMTGVGFLSTLELSSD